MTAFRPWRVLHHDLRESLPHLRPEAGRGGVQLVLWWDTLPLGHLDITTESLPLTPAFLEGLVVTEIAPAVGWHLFSRGFDPWLPGQDPRHQPPAPLSLASLCDPLKELDRKWSARRNGSAKGRDGRSLSVVICTRDRPEALERCLRSILRTETAPDEIVVVDNAPRSERTRALVDEMDGVDYQLEPRPGLSFARNTGVRSSHGEIVAFTDDDVVVHPTWIDEMKRAFTPPRVMSVTGLVLPAELDTEAQWIFEKGFGGFNRGYRGMTYGKQFYEATRNWGVPAWTLGAGANMGVRRAAFDEVGLFDERLGAGQSGCSEDSEFWYRLLAAGRECRYEPAAVVHHHHRGDLDGLDHQMFQYTRGHVSALLVQYANHGDLGNLRRLLAFFPPYFAKQAVVRLLKGPDERARGLPANVRGWFSGIAFYLRNRGAGAGHRGESQRAGGEPPDPHRGRKGDHVAGRTRGGAGAGDSGAHRQERRVQTGAE